MIIVAVYHYFHYDCSENVYFFCAASNPIHSENACFKGITNEMITRGVNACVLYEVLVFAPCPS